MDWRDKIDIHETKKQALHSRILCVSSAFRKGREWYGLWSRETGLRSFILMEVNIELHPIKIRWGWD